MLIPFGTGLGDCWWSEVSAAESSERQAAQYRQLCLESLQRRTLHLHLLAALLTTPPEPHVQHSGIFYPCSLTFHTWYK